MHICIYVCPSVSLPLFLSPTFSLSPPFSLSLSQSLSFVLSFVVLLSSDLSIDRSLSLLGLSRGCGRHLGVFHALAGHHGTASFSMSLLLIPTDPY